MSDTFTGLDNATPEAWEAWHREMLAQREQLDESVYDDPATAWSDTAFRQLFLFMYDAGFYDRGYRTEALIRDWRTKYGRIDEVVLWQGYPRLGFDSRTQFDFYRQMPGGLRGLRSEVCDVLHAHGVRVFVDYNPWDAGSYDELAEIITTLGADGVMLDTLGDVPTELAARVGPGVVFSPELRPQSLERARQSWAQWLDIGDERMPTVYRSRWLAPRHRQFAIARWDRSRKRDIVYSFFNGSGLVLWDNVFGAYNAIAREDRQLIAETAAIFDRYEDLFARGTWVPLVPTGISGLDANRFERDGRAILTLRNRTKQRLTFRAPGDGWVAFWGEGDPIVEPESAQALVLDAPDRVRESLEHFRALSARAREETRSDHERPRPRWLPPSSSTSGARRSANMIELPGGPFRMRIRHARRECGCYPLGATDDAMWGWSYKDEITHDLDVELAPFAIRATAVTNDEFCAFVRESGYEPADPERFLLGPNRDGAFPVTHVSLADARAFASFYGERLPTEAEWQWAAEGGRGHRFPWGNDPKSFPNVLRPAADAGTATPQGVVGLSGNAWEFTESEHTDGHTRFVMLRGGVYLAQGHSEWLPDCGARPNDSHAKYILLSDGLDRSAAISFRTVRGR